MILPRPDEPAAQRSQNSDSTGSHSSCTNAARRPMAEISLEAEIRNSETGLRRHIRAIRRMPSFTELRVIRVVDIQMV